MTTIEDQIELEKRMVANGVSRYQHTVQDADEAGRNADNQYAHILMSEFVSPVAESIKAFCSEVKVARLGKYKKLLRTVDPHKAAYFGLRCLFNHFTRESNTHMLGLHIGTMIEDELKFSTFREQQGDYYEAIIKDFKNKGTKSYRHMHRVLTHKAAERNVIWGAWTQEDRMSVGLKVLDCIVASTDLCIVKRVKAKNKTTIVVTASPQTKVWVENFHRYAELLNPDRLPCVIEPDPWTSISQGGYYTPQLRLRTPLVKTNSKKHIAMFDGDISNITEIINTIQSVPWQINKDVYKVFKQAWAQALPIGLPRSEPYEFPISPVANKNKEDFTEQDKESFAAWKLATRTLHTLENERISKCFQVIRVLRMASDYANLDKMWYVYHCDFRGRVYAAVSGLSPQGPDYAKSLLRFANGKELTERGAYWLKVHGANTYGEDKVSYDDRIKWVEANELYIIQAAKDPMSSKDFWGNADKPWQFLAFCFEYAKYKKEGPTMITHLPIGLDGSCNGLQNFSAMLRDNVGGAATNLVPANKPSDIYSEVASVCTSTLRGLNDPLAHKIIQIVDTLPNKVLPRSMAKKPVMTLPYGSTKQSCRESIYSFLVEEWPEHFKDGTERFVIAGYLTPILWDSIGNVVIAARQAMDWLQQCASIISKNNKPIVWWSPIGFPVYQDRKKIAVTRIRTQLAGSCQLAIANDSHLSDINKNKLGVAPNFVHSMDACHLMLTCKRASDYGIKDFAFIHDDYGTHACDIDTLHKSIREAFIELYEHNDPLIDFKIFNEDMNNLVLTDVPAKGQLNLGQVIDSKYFFG